MYRELKGWFCVPLHLFVMLNVFPLRYGEGKSTFLLYFQLNMYTCRKNEKNNSSVQVFVVNEGENIKNIKTMSTAIKYYKFLSFSHAPYGFIFFK